MSYHNGTWWYLRKLHRTHNQDSKELAYSCEQVCHHQSSVNTYKNQHPNYFHGIYIFRWWLRGQVIVTWRWLWTHLIIGWHISSRINCFYSRDLFDESHRNLNIKRVIWRISMHSTFVRFIAVSKCFFSNQLRPESLLTSYHSSRAQPLITTVKPVYNDHLMGYFSAFWSSSRWPGAT